MTVMELPHSILVLLLLCMWVLKQSFNPTTYNAFLLGGYVTDPHLEIVSSCPQSRDLLLLYHRTSHTHTIWDVKPAASEVQLCINHGGAMSM